MIHYHKIDLFEFIKTINDKYIIPHICNNKGGFGKGFVLPLAINFPQTSEVYHSALIHILGNTQFVEIPNGFVANMIAQTLGTKRPLYYNHLVHCMEQVRDKMYETKINTIIAPKFGSGLAKGNWDFIEELIKDCWDDFKVHICYLD